METILSEIEHLYKLELNYFSGTYEGKEFKCRILQN